MPEKRVYGPDQQALVQPEKLVAALKDSLVSKGVAFTQTAGLEDVLQAALDYIDPASPLASDKGKSNTTASTGSREEIITAALKGYDEGGSIAHVTTRGTFVEGAVRDAGLSPLTDAELIALPL